MRSSRFAIVVVLAACGGGSTGDTGASPAANDGGATATDSGGGSQSIAPPGNPPGTITPEAGASSDSGSSSEAGSSGDGSSGLAPSIPAPTGVCPTIANGDVTFAPAGIPARTVTISMSSAAQTKHGPLLFYWYATGSSVQEIPYALGSTLNDIEAAGGIVVAPHADPTAGQFEWFIVNGSSKMDDFLVADEIVACITKSIAIDTTHIHTMGMSAGAIQTTAMSYLRSSYVASVTTYSGGLVGGATAPASQNPANKFAALIFDGGPTDQAFSVDFQAASVAYKSSLAGAGHFTAICDHGMGHAIPTAAAPSVFQFFLANGFGVTPSPYASGLPASFPSYCTL